MVKLLTAAVIALTLMFVGLLWLVAILAKVTLWLPGGVTLFLVFAAITVLVVRRFSARKAARGLEQALAQQAKVQAKVTRPDLRLEIQGMASEFDKAVQALKHSRIARGSGADALYVLPWYTIIGPPGAGKSTALRNSGLDFPYLSNGGGVRGLGGTRNCDWWMTNHAVILDTAGRWTTQEEDHDEWIAFLDQLRKHRPRKPLNGLIVAISIQDIATSGEDQIVAVARRVRERLDEVMGHLRVSLPVYVLFTKCDLVQGFVDMFGDLPKSERGQVWGFTAPIAAPVGEPAPYFRERFDELLRMLEHRALKRLGNERHLPVRQRIYEFPQQVLAARDSLATFIGALFLPSVYDETPTMRGVYLTSGTQEGRPFDLLMNRLAQSMGIQARIPIASPAVDAKSYFLRDVFTDVIFEDRNVASASTVELRRQRLIRIAVTSVFTTIALALSIAPTMTWGASTHLLRSTTKLLSPWEERHAPNKQAEQRTAVHLSDLQPLHDTLKRLQRYEEDGTPWTLGLGMYQGDTLIAPANRLFARLIGRDVVEPLLAADVQVLSDFGWKYEALPRAHPTPEEHALMYDVLKLHILLSGPRAEGEPNLVEDAEAREWVALHLTERWASTATLKSDSPEREAMATTIGVYLEALKQDPSLILPRDTDVVRRAREALTRVPFAERMLTLVVEALDDEGYDLTLDRMLGATGGSITARGKVRGAFTRRAWDGEVRQTLIALSEARGKESWVLAESGTTAGSAEEQLSALRSAYFRAYVSEWQEWLRGLRVQPAEDSVQALSLLQTLTRGHPAPLGVVIQRIAYNLALKDPEPKHQDVKALAEGVLDKVTRKLTAWAGDEATEKAQGAVANLRAGTRDEFPITQVAKAFEGFTRFGVAPDMGDGPAPTVALDVYQEQLQYVRDALQMQVDDPENSEDLMTRLQGARTRVRALIEEQEIGWRPLFEVLLWPPIESASLTSTLAVAASAGRSWCTEVVTPHARALRGRYPFDPRGQDASLADFTRFFAPETGLLWQFYKDAFDARIEREGDRFSFRRKLGGDAANAYHASLLPFLQRASDITTSFFDHDAEEPKVAFEVRIHPTPTVATIQLSVGGEAIEYHNGPELWSKLSWPGKSPADGAAFIVRGANGMRERVAQEGEWGLFRLLESGTVRAISARQFTVAWQMRTHRVDVVMDFRPLRSEAPFFGIAGRDAQPQLFQPLRVPAAQVPMQIVTDGRPCRIP